MTESTERALRRARRSPESRNVHWREGRQGMPQVVTA
jgi:hypothetical protein